MPGTDGSNWYARYANFPGHVESSTVRGHELWVAYGTGRSYCRARCDTRAADLLRVLPQPSIQLVVVDRRRWRVARERWLWDRARAYGFPALATNAAGDVGLAFVQSSVPGNPIPGAGMLTPDEQLASPLPSSLPVMAGDYYSARPGPTPGSFAMTGYTVQGDPVGQRVHWHYVEYGRGRAPLVRPPFVSIDEPRSGTTFFSGQRITYRARVSDPQDGTLPPDAIVWQEDGRVIGRGEQISRYAGFPGEDAATATPIGDHTMRVTATNGEGRSASAEVTVRVAPPPPPGSSSLSLSCPQYAAVNQPFEVFGTLAPRHVDAPIRVVYTHAGLATTHQVHTNFDSEYRDAFTPTGFGDVAVQAHFDGDGDHQPSSSPACTVTVVQSPP